MNYRFNSFYQNEMHPFVTKVLDALLESGRRMARTALENRARIWSKQQYDEHIHYCWNLCDQIVAERKAHPKDVNDLLNVMLLNADPDTGEKMSDELIRYEMMTFLVAGHDTTSGLLNFAFLSMLKNPKTLQQAQEEVDRVIGDDAIEPGHFEKLKYIEAIMVSVKAVLMPLHNRWWLTSFCSERPSVCIRQLQLSPAGRRTAPKTSSSEVANTASIPRTF
jgi:cytochrome P450 / NADPH-cytochrome P450 reductase